MEHKTESIKIHNRSFRPMISAEEIASAVERVAARINEDYRDCEQSPLVMGVLNGSFIFMADLVRQLDVRCELIFVKMSSYSGLSTTGKVRTMIGLNQDITGRDVIVVEDIVDTGVSIAHVMNMLRSMGAGSVRVCTLFFKPDSYRADEHIDYKAMEIGSEFIVGYGLDYDGLGRELGGIYVVEEEA
ncbi:MAG: hypoxanthine phosphoribosyltransferase [Rikenellaceae bacterium]